jgi:ABC-2 type transport system ATP-binding protein
MPARLEGGSNLHPAHHHSLQVYCLLGAGGSGKTTLLRMVVGDLVPESGHVRVLGADAASADVGGPSIGYCPQQLGLFEDLTCVENLRYFGSLCGMTVGEVEKSYDRLRRELSLPKKDALVGSLSRGQQVLVSVACAMQHAPSVLVLDDVLSGLDAVRTATIWRALTTRAQVDTQMNCLVFDEPISQVLPLLLLLLLLLLLFLVVFIGFVC